MRKENDLQIVNIYGKEVHQQCPYKFPDVLLFSSSFFFVLHLVVNIDGIIKNMGHRENTKYIYKSND